MNIEKERANVQLQLDELCLRMQELEDDLKDADEEASNSIIGEMEELSLAQDEILIHMYNLDAMADEK